MEQSERSNEDEEETCNTTMQQQTSDDARRSEECAQNGQDLSEATLASVVRTNTMQNSQSKPVTEGKHSRNAGNRTETATDMTTTYLERATLTRHGRCSRRRHNARETKIRHLHREVLVQQQVGAL